MELSEKDILNAMTGRIIKNAYYEDPAEATLVIELHDGLKIKVNVKPDTDISGNISDAWLELGLTNG